MSKLKAAQPKKTVKEETIDSIYSQLEYLEDNRTTGYVPAKDGKVIGTSGVTIGMGLDLGAHSENDLTSMGIPKNIITALKPYLGLKGNAAVNKRTATPLTLKAEDVKTLNKKVKQDKYDKISRKFKNRVGRSLEDEAVNVRQAIILAGFNLGESGLFGRDAYTDKNKKKHAKTTTNFATQLKNKQYSDAAVELKKWNESEVIGLRARRGAEGALLAGTIKIDNVSFTKDTLVTDLKIQKAIDEVKTKTPVATAVSPVAALNTGSLDQALQAVQPQGVVVNRGDTLSSIARNTGVDVNALIQLNGITDPNMLMVGQQLKTQ